MYTVILRNGNAIEETHQAGNIIRAVGIAMAIKAEFTEENLRLPKQDQWIVDGDIRKDGQYWIKRRHSYAHNPAITVTIEVANNENQT